MKMLLALIAAGAMVVAFGQWAIAGEELDEAPKEAAFIPPPPDLETQSMVTTFVPEEDQVHNQEAR